jgi:hypothetical protein
MRRWASLFELARPAATRIRGKEPGCRRERGRVTVFVAGVEALGVSVGLEDMDCVFEAT